MHRYVIDRFCLYVYILRDLFIYPSMQYIRVLSMQKKFLEKNRVSIDHILDSWVHGDKMTDETKTKPDTPIKPTDEMKKDPDKNDVFFDYK